MGRGSCGAGGPDYLCPLLNRQRRGDLLCIAVPFALYFCNQQLKYRVDVPVLGYLLRCHVNDWLGGIAFAAYLNLILSLSRWPEKRLRRPGQFAVAGLLCGLFWEGIAPLFLPGSTADLLDVAAYVLGMLTYWMLWGRRTV